MVGAQWMERNRVKEISVGQLLIDNYFSVMILEGFLENCKEYGETSNPVQKKYGIGK